MVFTGRFMKPKTGNIAVIHDWLTGLRGGELVLENILDVIGPADIYTLFYRKGSVSKKIERNAIYTSFLDKIPFSSSFYRYLLPLMPSAIEALDVTGYKYIISSSHCAAKGIIPHPGSVHICYVHTPMRYIWDQSYVYFDLNKLGIRNLVKGCFLSRLRQWDVTSSNRVDYFIANSGFVRERIKKYYNREAQVIYPPCDTAYFGDIMHSREDFYLMVSALNEYKKVDAVIPYFNKTGKKLIIVGYGPLMKKLRSMAGKNIEFYEKVSKETLRELYQKARAFIQMSMEDFGMAAVEAQSAMTPVVAFGRGGAAETVIPGKTGILFYEQKEEELKKALDLIEKIDIVRDNFLHNTERFSMSCFQTSFESYLNERGVKIEHA